jgi:methyltransferase family protein
MITPTLLEMILKMRSTKMTKKISAYRKHLKRLLHKPKWYDLRSTEPISRAFGYDRGLPVGRYYIDKFLSNNRHYIRGHVLEVSEDKYIKRFGGDVLSYDILHYTHENPKATIVGDLTDLSTLPNDKYDCFICPQTVNFIYNFHEAIKGIYYLLAEGGVVLTTLAGLMQISRYDMDKWGDYWRFTTLSAYKLFSNVFGENNVKVDFFGNVLASLAVLEGITSEELTPEELYVKDEDYQIIVTVVATKKNK